MSNREKQNRDARWQGGSFTVGEWCDYRRISRAMFYKLDQQGLTPRSYYVGAKRLISDEADAAWMRAREAEADTPTAA
jgi:hypothetical protein